MKGCGLAWSPHSRGFAGGASGVVGADFGVRAGESCASLVAAFVYGGVGAMRLGVPAVPAVVLEGRVRAGGWVAEDGEEKGGWEEGGLGGGRVCWCGWMVREGLGAWSVKIWFCKLFDPFLAFHRDVYILINHKPQHARGAALASLRYDGDFS